MPAKNNFAALAVLAVTLLLATAAATAQPTPSFDAVSFDTSTGSTSRGYVGGGLYYGPRYLGSDEHRVLPLPIVGYRWANGFFVGTGNGVGYNVAPQRGLNFGARLTVDFGRRESTSDALRGMGNISPHPEVGIYFNAALEQGMFVTSTLRYGAGGNGLISDLGFGWGTEVAPAWRLRLGVGTTLANGSYMQDYFGVNATQAANSGYPEFHANAGVRDVRASVGLGHPFTPSLIGFADVTVRSLRSDARQSPITRQGTSANFVAGVLYAF